MTQKEIQEPREQVRIAWLELSCLACGEIAGFIEDGRNVRAVHVGGIVVDKGKLRCGRCNALLFCGHRGVARSRFDIG